MNWRNWRNWRNWLGLCLLCAPLLGLLVWSGWMVMGWRFLLGTLIGGIWLSLGWWLAGARGEGYPAMNDTRQLRIVYVLVFIGALIALYFYGVPR